MSQKTKFYSDENVSSIISNGLRIRGIDILTTVEAKMLQATDTEQLSFASRQKRVLITQDNDFLRLHAAGVKHSGIVYAHQQKPIGEIIRLVTLIHEVLSADEMKNHVEFL